MSLTLESAPPEIATVVERLLGGRAELEPMPGGRNSRLFRARRDDGTRCAVKWYVRAPAHGRDRLAVEFGALRLLTEHGIRQVPRPIASDPGAGVALFEWIDGDAIAAGHATREDIDAAVAFIAELQSARAAAQVEPAAEACFSVSDIEDILWERRRRLGEVERTHPMGRELAAFVAGAFDPAWRRLTTRTQRRLDEQGHGWNDRLPEAHRILSPSDFGFHNALRRPDGLVFVDFEYFGWDDPAKLIADVALHPGMALSESLAARFASGLCAALPKDTALAERVRLLWPWFGLKWCLILLNEFVREDLARREFAGAWTAQGNELCAQQLTKARAMLARVMKTDDRFLDA